MKKKVLKPYSCEQKQEDGKKEESGLSQLHYMEVEHEKTKDLLGTVVRPSSAVEYFKCDCSACYSHAACV